MKKILLATDGSKHSQYAAEFLAHLPHDETIELTVVSVLYVHGSERTYLVGDWIETCLEQERSLAEEAYSKVESVFAGADVKLNHIVREGHPGETITAIAKEVRPELVVVGATGHSAVARMMLGSTSDYVATHAPCSVLVIRPTEGLQGGHELRIAIGYEDTGPAQAALEEFREFRWGAETQVNVLTVSYSPGFYDVPEYSDRYDFVHEAAKQLHDVAPKATGQLIDSDHVGEGFVRFTEANDCDLIVLGETPRTRLGRVLLGSMTRYVLRHASCSVWITRNRMIHGSKKDSEAPSESVAS